jgi:hypothetical protein
LKCLPLIHFWPKCFNVQECKTKPCFFWSNLVNKKIQPLIQVRWLEIDKNRHNERQPHHKLSPHSSQTKTSLKYSHNNHKTPRCISFQETNKHRTVSVVTGTEFNCSRDLSAAAKQSLHHHHSWQIRITRKW